MGFDPPPGQIGLRWYNRLHIPLLKLGVFTIWGSQLQKYCIVKNVKHIERIREVYVNIYVGTLRTLRVPDRRLGRQGHLCHHGSTR